MEYINGQDINVKTDINILVVDDREDNLFAIETILEKDNYTITKANSGRAALKILLQQHNFSLILMDVQMPGLSGFETATLIYERDKLKDIPIIFITAQNYDEEYVFKGYKMGAVDYIYKPINPELLRAKVGVFVELYRKNQQLLLHREKLIATNLTLQKEIEERKASEEKISLLNDQLIKSNTHLKIVNEELDRFAYVASHDLQEPLRKIMVFIDKILAKQNMDDDTGKYFQKIIDSANRMQSLINDLLSFSKQAVSPSDFKEVDLNLLIKDVMIELEIEIEKTKTEFQLMMLPAICAVPALIRQVFYNLVNNALKFRKPSVAPVIKITAEKINDYDNRFPAFLINNCKYYKITVTDNGIGFDPKYAEDIFIVFKRLHSYHEFKGTGVGLSICKKIIENHNGHIMAESKPDEGSSFIIYLPEKPVTSVHVQLQSGSVMIN
jgi:signal transduction histidine kinase